MSARYREFSTELDTNGVQVTTVARTEADAVKLVDTLRGFVHEWCRQLFTGLGGTPNHGWVMFTSFDSSGALARAASGCSW
ncbi:hypothetical protein [Streptomyces californicus]|uniref:hypothetical protein n=1 Tax=Streptomyces californicus TaxID=67351 RepID=UPI003791F03E